MLEDYIEILMKSWLFKSLIQIWLKMKLGSSVCTKAFTFVVTSQPTEWEKLLFFIKKLL